MCYSTRKPITLLVFSTLIPYRLVTDHYGRVDVVYFLWFSLIIILNASSVSNDT